MTTHLEKNWPWLLVAAYLLLASLYAVQTPLWQAPDEPAHYNYVKYLAETGHLPELIAGDFPTAYLEEIKNAKFPPHMSIDPIRYESWQPPLYYALGALVYLPVRQLDLATQVQALRLLSVAIGAALMMAYAQLMRHVFSRRPLLAALAATLPTLIPMHVAMLAAINNDGLAELFIVSALWLSIVLIQEGISQRRLVQLGAVCGLCLLTKNTAAFALPIAIIAIWLSGRDRLRHPQPRWTAWLAYWTLPVFLLAGWLYVRNGLVYGWTDPLIWQRHGQVAGRQLTRATYVADHGFWGWIGSYIQTTFRSFWGQFGWMAVPMDRRIYLALGVLTGLAGLGLLLIIDRWWRRYKEMPALVKLRWQELLPYSPLALSLLFTIGLYLWYNRGFVQFQGRYLFPALAPIAIGLALGWREIVKPGNEWWVIGSLSAVAWVTLGKGIASSHMDKYSLLWLCAGAVAFVVKRRLPNRCQLAFLAPIPLFLLVLTALTPAVYVMPFLSPGS